jgi:hypothetical protein
MAGPAEYLVYALARDTERSGELGLIGAGLIRGEQRAAEVAPRFVQALKRIERLLIGA